MVKRRARGRREGVFKARCVRHARALGIQVAKLTECAGIPDSIFFVPGGAPLVPEFKDPGGDGLPSVAQVWHLIKLREQGYDAPLLSSWEEFLKLVSEALASDKPKRRALRCKVCRRVLNSTNDLYSLASANKCLVCLAKTDRDATRIVEMLQKAGK